MDNELLKTIHDIKGGKLPLSKSTLLAYLYDNVGFWLNDKHNPNKQPFIYTPDILKGYLFETAFESREAFDKFITNPKNVWGDDNDIYFKYYAGAKPEKMNIIEALNFKKKDGVALFDLEAEYKKGAEVRLKFNKAYPAYKIVETQKDLTIDFNGFKLKGIIDFLVETEVGIMPMDTKHTSSFNNFVYKGYLTKKAKIEVATYCLLTDSQFFCYLIHEEKEAQKTYAGTVFNDFNHELEKAINDYLEALTYIANNGYEAYVLMQEELELKQNLGEFFHVL